MNTLFDLIKAVAHRNDAEPSHEAAQMMNRTKTTQGHALIVLAVLNVCEEPMTAVEIAEGIVEFDRIEVSRRLSGLEKAGLVEKCGSKKHCNKSYSLWRMK